MRKGNHFSFSSKQSKEQSDSSPIRIDGIGMKNSFDDIEQSKKLPRIEKHSNESLLNNSYPRFVEKEKRSVVNPQLELPLLTQSNNQLKRNLFLQNYFQKSLKDNQFIQNQILWKSNIHLFNKPKLTFPITPTDALKYYRNDLTRFEMNEIVNYNKIYYIGHRSNKIDGNQTKDYDDQDGFYCEREKDQISYRYEICCRIGKGSFGIVVRCYDHQFNEFVACKILRRKKRFQKQGFVEISILNHFNSLTNPHKSFVVQMKDYFIFRSHICIIFQLLGINLYQLIQLNNSQGFPYGLVKRFTISLLKCLQLLNEESIIHCDLKPENILLRKKGSSSIKLIDFGSACFQSSKIYTYIQSRYYRSPEIILGIDYTTAIDMWSLSCIIVELLTGQPLFDGDNEEEQILMFIQLIGLPDKSLLKQGKRTQLFFDNDGEAKIFSQRVNQRKSRPNQLMKEVYQRTDQDFVHFLLQCLQWNPSIRLRAKDALTHQTFL